MTDSPDRQSRRQETSSSSASWDAYDLNGGPKDKTSKPGNGAGSGNSDSGAANDPACDKGGGRAVRHHMTAAEEAWRPDPNSQSESAQRWRRGNDASKSQPLQLDSNGVYKTTDADCLSTIAARSLKDQGQAANTESIKHEMARIVSLNTDAYPDMAKNAHIIQPGMELRMTGKPCKEPDALDIPPMRQAQPEPDRQTNRQTDRGPAPDDRDQGRSDRGSLRGDADQGQYDRRPVVRDRAPQDYGDEQAIPRRREESRVPVYIPRDDRDGMESSRGRVYDNRGYVGRDPGYDDRGYRGRDPGYDDRRPVVIQERRPDIGSQIIGGLAEGVGAGVGFGIMNQIFRGGHGHRDYGGVQIFNNPGGNWGSGAWGRNGGGGGSWGGGGWGGGGEWERHRQHEMWEQRQRQQQLYYPSWNGSGW